MKPTICIDFDGTLHDYKHPVPGRRMGPPVEGALDAVRMFQAAGFRVLICTANDTAHIPAWLAYYRFPELPIVTRKPLADIYIDDRGFRFEGWNSTTFKAVSRLMLERQR